MKRFATIAVALAALAGAGLSTTAEAGDRGWHSDHGRWPTHGARHIDRARGRDHRPLSHERNGWHGREDHDARWHRERHDRFRSAYRHRDHDEHRWRHREYHGYRATGGYAQGIGFTVDGVTFLWSNWGAR